MMRGLDERGQTSMELLLLLAGIILFAFVIMWLLKTMVREQIAPEANELAQNTAGKFG
ncbi:MAG: class III signal peptide-containing protein [Candidatus Diapherotrites archaeon]